MKKNLINIITGTVCGILVSIASFYSILFLSARTFLSSYSGIAISVLICTLLLLGFEYARTAFIVTKKGKMFYGMCFTFYFVGVTALTYLVLQGMDQIALVLYYIPTGLLIFGLRIFLHIIDHIRRKNKFLE